MTARLWGASMALMLGLAVGSCAAGGNRPTPSPAADADFAGIPDVSFEYYDVVGDDPQSIRRSINQRRPVDDNDGSRVDAMTVGSIDFGLPHRQNARCKAGDISVRLRLRVILPRLRDPSALAPEAIARWNAFVAGLKRHEAWHARYAHDHMPDLKAAMRSADCDHARDAAAEALAVIGRAQLEYDRATHHGADQGVSFP